VHALDGETQGRISKINKAKITHFSVGPYVLTALVISSGI
jgi:hypothetical protein